MTTYQFSDLIWSKTNLIIHGNTFYRLYHLAVEPAEPDSEEAVEKLYLIKHNRTQELICRVIVPSDQVQEFKTFQNALVMSKLNAFDW